MKVKIEELLKAGVHFGHQTKRWHPKNEAFYFCRKKQHSHHRSWEVSRDVETSLWFCGKISAEGKNILFLGTKKQAKEIVTKAAKKAEVPYITERWLGGTFTNFVSIKNLIKRLRRLKKEKKQAN